MLKSIISLKYPIDEKLSDVLSLFTLPRTAHIHKFTFQLQLHQLIDSSQIHECRKISLYIVPCNLKVFIIEDSYADKTLPPTINTVINSFILIKILLLITSKTHEKVLKLTPNYN